MPNLAIDQSFIQVKVVFNDLETNMPVYLRALALQNYRGIGQTLQKMSNFKTFNFFIGANNAGKPTVLNFISGYLPPPPISSLLQTQAKQIDLLERHGGQAGSSIYMALGFTKNHVIDAIATRYPVVRENAHYKDGLSKIITALCDKEGVLWKGSLLPYQQKLGLDATNPAHLRNLLRPDEWQQLWSALTVSRGGDILHHWIPNVVDAIDGAVDISMPTVRLIPAIRKIGPKGASVEDFSGAGLIDRLAAIQNPEHDRREGRATFDRINRFLRFVTGKPEAEIEIPYSRDHILVHMDGRVLPLDSLGTGVQEVIMIAAYCTMFENAIICIEEPEIHLHPLLQRKLIAYLEKETQNQYFIATHSAAFIDTPGAAIFHVFLENNTTQIREAVLKKDRFAICVDLGHRASDIVQANAVVWVEGPSDRIYLKHWISIADPNLVEGIHYSIMFYGGRLLNHLSADDEEISDFIQLRALNRHLAIMMDSDKGSAHTPVNATKLRIKNEFEKHGGIAWVTKGREVENYIDHTRLQSSVKKVYGEIYSSAHLGSSFDHALYFLRVAPKKRRRTGPVLDLIERDVDKIKVSRAVVNDGMHDLNVLDLRDRVTQVVQMISRANK